MSTRYFFSQRDGDSYAWYMVPVERREEWDALEYDDGVPDWAIEFSGESMERLEFIPLYSRY